MTVEPVVSAELVRSADKWAETIRADLGRAVEGIGRVLQEQGAARATRSPAPADDPFGSAPVADEAPF